MHTIPPVASITHILIDHCRMSHGRFDWTCASASRQYREPNQFCVRCPWPERRTNWTRSVSSPTFDYAGIRVPMSFQDVSAQWLTRSNRIAEPR
jgi:hypothetical protein